MPGGDPLAWSLADLESAVRVKNKERQFFLNLAHYMTYWIVSAVKPNAIELLDLSPENFIVYLNAKKEEAKKQPARTMDPEQKKYIDKQADLRLYQNYHKRKAKAKK